MQIIGVASENLKAVENGGGNGMPTNNEQIVIEVPSSSLSSPSSPPSPAVENQKPEIGTITFSPLPFLL